MNLISRIYYIFSQFANPQEKRVGKFFSNVSEKSSKEKVSSELLNLLQKDIICFNLFSEYKYKGYKYLASNRKRRQLYSNTFHLVEDFNSFCTLQKPDKAIYFKKFYSLEELTEGQQERLDYLNHIMAYLNPDRGIYTYRESASFGELLKNPKIEKLIGDCNQIVTLYIYLYSLKFSISDLSLVVPTNHVALYFLGLQIEATRGVFIQPEDGADILPIQEIASINLMDVTDSYFKTHQISASVLLEASKLSYLISSKREVAQKNLKASYHNTVIELVKRQKYKEGLHLSRRIKDSKLVDYVSRNAINFYIGKNKFSEARKYAVHTVIAKDLTKQIYLTEAAYFYNKQQYAKALEIYKKIGDEEMIRNCYKGLFIQESKNLGHLKTLDDIKKNRSILNKMNDYAKKADDNNLIKYMQQFKIF